MAYLSILGIAMLALYFVLYAFFPLFFEGARTSFDGEFWARAWKSLAILAAAIIAGYIAVYHIRDLEFGNRVLHVWNGGFVAFLTSYRAMRDSGVRLRRFQFIVMAALMVTSLGVLNELFEFYMQVHGIRVFLRTPYDTWLDLFSNTIGIAIASALFYISDMLKP